MASRAACRRTSRSRSRSVGQDPMYAGYIASAFLLPDGSQLVGDQLRFIMAGAAPVAGLDNLSLTCSNLAALVILGESGRQLLSPADYFPELTAPAFLKRFIAHFFVWNWPSREIDCFRQGWL